jgi:hypothetical protein
MIAYNPPVMISNTTTTTSSILPYYDAIGSYNPNATTIYYPTSTTGGQYYAIDRPSTVQPFPSYVPIPSYGPIPSYIPPAPVQLTPPPGYEWKLEPIKSEPEPEPEPEPEDFIRGIEFD